MRAIIGLGNPGNRYQLTRHNAGFLLLDYLAEYFNLQFVPSRYDFYWAKGSFQNSPFILLKPATYMNNSGIALLQLQESENVKSTDMLVCYDDFDLNPGDVRIKSGGGAGTHNGIESIIYHLNTNEFPRLRIGIGRNFSRGEMADYVLGNFEKQDFEKLLASFDFCRELVLHFITGGLRGMLDQHSILKKQMKPRKDPDSGESVSETSS